MRAILSGARSEATSFVKRRNREATIAQLAERKTVDTADDRRWPSAEEGFNVWSAPKYVRQKSLQNVISIKDKGLAWSAADYEQRNGMPIR